MISVAPPPATTSAQRSSSHSNCSPVFQSWEEEAACVVALLRDASWASLILPELRVEDFSDRVIQVMISAAMRSDQIPDMAALIRQVRGLCSIQDPVRDILESVRVMLGIGIEPSRLQAMALSVHAGPPVNGLSMPPLPTWMHHAQIITKYLPSVDLMGVPLCPGFMAQTKIMVRDRLRAKAIAAAIAAVRAHSRPAPSRHPADDELSSIETAARPFFYEIVLHWLPGGELVSNGEYEVRNAYRADDQPGFHLHVADDDACTLWKDSTHGKGRGVVRLAVYLFGMTMAEAMANVAGMVGLRSPATDPRFAKMTGTIALPLSTRVAFEGEYVPDGELPYIWDITFPECGEHVEVWGYHSIEGQWALFIVRFRLPNGDKDYRPFTRWRSQRNGSVVWRQKFPDVLPLYNMQRLMADPLAPVVLVEGEKSADVIDSIMPSPWIVSTWPMAANGIPRVELTCLRGRLVLLWADADDAGDDTMRRMAQRLNGVAAQVVIISPQVIATARGVASRDKWDAADAVADGWSSERIANLLGAARQVR
ncbi:MAG: hypothetical protein H0W83_00200 [Planctomycetes bacterium]|nr:hypothetical protein [Planctomycetota bacterium]